MSSKSNGETLIINTQRLDVFSWVAVLRSIGRDAFVMGKIEDPSLLFDYVSIWLIPMIPCSQLPLSNESISPALVDWIKFLFNDCCDIGHIALRHSTLVSNCLHIFHAIINLCKLDPFNLNDAAFSFFVSNEIENLCDASFELIASLQEFASAEIARVQCVNEYGQYLTLLEDAAGQFAADRKNRIKHVWSNYKLLL